MTSGFEEISSRPVAEHTAAEVAAVMTRSFEGYLVSIKMTAQAYERRFRGEDLDPFASRVYYAVGTDAPVGLVLVARRGWTSRIAAMGLAPEARGQGLGRRLLSEAVEEAKARGDRAVLLEVIEQNTPAVHLYTSFGFQTVRRLFGYRKQRREETAPPPEARDVLSEIDPLDFSRIAAREGDIGLPWMLAAETLSAASHPARAVHLDGRAFALISDPGAEMIALSALVVPRADRRQGLGSRLVRALEATFPGKTWAVSAIVPEDLAPDFFPKLGWERQKLNQFEMRLELVQLPLWRMISLCCRRRRKQDEDRSDGTPKHR
jgi:ribosomal protein S18 acetylase RimI-like enzyme